MSAETLRRTAALMRERAEAVPDGVWRTGEAFDDPLSLFTTFVASWHPAVAFAVADWLEAEASAMDSMDKFTAVTSDLVREEKFNIRGAAMTVSLGKNGSIGIKADTSTPALAVARAYLGETS